MCAERKRRCGPQCQCQRAELAPQNLGNSMEESQIQTVFRYGLFRDAQAAHCTAHTAEKVSEQGRVLFHERINFGMPARWMSHCVDNDKTSHNCAVCWNNLPSSMLLPLLNRQLLIVSCNFCSYPLTCCDNFMLMACTPFCEQRTLEQKLQNKRK